MSFAIFTDSCSNLPGRLLRSLDIRVMPCAYSIGEKQVSYNGDIDHFQAKEHYDLLRAGQVITTTLINSGTFAESFRPALEEGLDIVYVGISSGVSGTYQAASIAALELKEEFPQRAVYTVDSLGAGLGTGLLACRAADHRKQGLSAAETAEKLLEERAGLCEFFTVDSLHYLRRSGRISAATAAVGTMLNIKPLLRGDEEGHIVSCGKYRGRKKAVEAILQKYADLAVDPENSRVAITHGDCLADAQALAEQVRAIAAPGELIVCPHEPFTGSHVGPGMLALFFFGRHR
ncbi:MAG TPA: DegV family protein [Candidatus Faecousia intestinigallinarum]|nr:DegV family protein [Candidatus Faecousia intestinigallinarum]